MSHKSVDALKVTMPELFEEFKNFNAAIFEEFEKLANS